MTMTTMQSTVETTTATQLPPRQRAVLDEIRRYYDANGRAVPAQRIADHLGVHRSTIRKHITDLHRKGWLKTASSPSIPAR